MYENYIIVERDTAQELALAVSNRCKNGYAPHGSMVIALNNAGHTKYIYLQPMVLVVLPAATQVK